MFGYEYSTLAIISAAIFIGGIVKGVSGIGLPIVTIAVVVNFVPAPVALAIVVIPILVTNLWQAVRAGNLFAPFREFEPMILCFVVCLVITAHLIVNLDTKTMFGALGICVTIFSLSNFIRPPAKPLSLATRTWAAPLAGILGGILGGVSTIWGPPMMMYLVLLKLPKDIWVRVIGMVWFVGSVPLTLSYWANGILNEQTLPLSIYACIPGMAGILVGERLRNLIDQETFRKFLLAALFFIGINLIRRSVF